MRLLDDEDLRAKGIRYGRQHRWRLIKDGKFPKPVKGAGAGNRWLEDEIDAWLEGLRQKRDQQGKDEAA